MFENKYEGVLYRPPSEARSVIVQSTIGCSHNRCSFCSMYKDKQFRLRKMSDVIDDLADFAKQFANYNVRVFFADGDALVRSTAEQIQLYRETYRLFPKIERISCYGSAKTVLLKSERELKQLKYEGLDMVYLGLESGDDEVLRKINKGTTSVQIIEAAKRLHHAGIQVSVTAILGIAGRKGSRRHAQLTGEVLSKMNPDYIGLLTLMLEPDTILYQQWEAGEFNLISPDEVLLETKCMLECIDSPGSIFRSNHASNYLNLAGILNKDRDNMIAILDDALSGKVQLKEEYYREL